MKLIVDAPQRYAKMRAHTATHLLHCTLDTVLHGTKQAGSLVDNDYLRFDFAAKQPLSSQELHTIETTINQRIFEAYDVITQETSFADAKALGAKAFFEDKYGDRVRVVQIVSHTGPESGKLILHSIELCGGTHVSNTKDIGAFKILWQEAVASGIRRIIAVTGPNVAAQARDLEDILEQLASKFDAQPKQLFEKTDKFLTQYADLKNTYEGLLTSHIRTTLLQTASTGHLEDFDHSINLSVTPLATIPLKDIATVAKTVRQDTNWLLYTNDGSYAIGTKTGFSAKAFLQTHGLKGWGSDTFVQGKDETILWIASS